METKGTEQSPLAPSKTPISQSGGAKSGELKDNFIQKYPNLEDILNASDLPKDFNRALIAELKTT